MRKFAFVLLAQMLYWEIATAQSDNQQALGIVETSLAMLARFEKFSCEYECASTGVRSLADVHAKKYVRTPITAQFRWYQTEGKVSQSAVKLEDLKRDSNSPSKKTTPFPGNKNLSMGEPTPFTNQQLIRDDSYWLDLSESPSRATVDKIDPGYRMEPPIFGCVNRSRCSYETQVLKEDLLTKPISANVKTMMEGKRTFVVIQTTRQDNPETSTYWFAPDWGYLCVKCITHYHDDVELIHHNEVYAARQFGDRWFPTHKIRAFKQKQMDRWEIRESKVTKLEVDVEPPRSAFEVKLPRRTWVHDHSREMKFSFTTQRDETVHVDDLPRIYDMLTEAGNTPRVNGRLLMETRIQPRSYKWWYIAGTLTALSFLGMGGWIVSRKRKS